MDTLQLLNAMRREPALEGYKSGVFPRDKLPAKADAFIFNTEPASSPGRHWIAVFMGAEVTHFDPLGEPVPIDLVKYYQANHARTITYLKRPVQPADSDTCGYHCLYFLRHRARGLSLATLLRKYYTDNLVLNDCLVLHGLSR